MMTTTASAWPAAGACLLQPVATENLRKGRGQRCYSGQTSYRNLPPHSLAAYSTITCYIQCNPTAEIFTHEIYIMIHNMETKLAFDITFFACTVRTCLHIMQSQAIIIIYRFIKLFQHFMWCMSAVQRSCMPLIDEKMVFLPTETEKPRPIIAYNPMTITPTPHLPTPLLNIWPWGIKCTHLSDLALRSYISLFTYNKKLTGQCIDAWCWLCACGLRSSGPRLQGTYNLVICGVYLICAGWARTMCLCKLLSDCIAGTPCI